MHGMCNRPKRSDTAQQTQCYTRHSTKAVLMLANVAVVGPTLKQYWVNACVCWEDCIIFLQICRNTMQSSHLPSKHKVVHHHVSVSRDLFLCRYHGYSQVKIMSLSAFDTDSGPVVRDPQKSCRTTRTFKPSGPMDHRNFRL